MHRGWVEKEEPGMCTYIRGVFVPVCKSEVEEEVRDKLCGE